MDWVLLTSETLDVGSLIQWATDATTGAISTFSGTTRDNFDGKQVVKLAYEAYEPMAVSKMRQLCQEVRSKWDVHKVGVHHRVGEVPVLQTSVVIVVSSAHRREALEGVAYAIDWLKAEVPIWKKEHYDDGSEWKANKEFDRAFQPSDRLN